MLEQERQDFRAALISAVVANATPRKKRRRPFVPADFMPGRKMQKRKPQTPEQMLRFVEMLNAAFGGSDQRKRGLGK